MNRYDGPRYPGHFEEVLSLPRRNIAPQAKAIIETGFKKPAEDPLTPPKKYFGLFGSRDFSPTPEEALEIYHNGKEERYALSAVLINRVVNRALAQRTGREPYGLIGFPLDYDSLTEQVSENQQPEDITWLGLPDPFSALQVHMQRTLTQSWLEEMSYLDDLRSKKPQHKLSQVYNRLLQWQDCYTRFSQLYEHELEARNSFNPVFTEIPTGISTGIFVMSKFLQVLPQVCERDVDYKEITPDSLVEIARNSYPFIAKLAMLPFDTSSLTVVLTGNAYGIRKGLIRFTHLEDPKSSFNPIYFEAIETKSGDRVNMRESIWHEVEFDMAHVKSSEQKVTTGCPAMVRFDGDESAVQKLWDWHLDIASKVYRDFWSARYEPAGAKEARYNFIKTNAEERGYLVAGIHF